MQVLLVFLIISGVLVVIEQKTIRMIFYTEVLSLISSVCFLFFSAPDVAMAEAVVSVFSTIIFIVAFEKYVNLTDLPVKSKNTLNVKSYIPHLVFTIFLLILFIRFIPSTAANTFLKDQYTTLFLNDVGGENAVTAIYLGYRMYDTLFEALMLLISIIAIVHMSWYEDGIGANVKLAEVNKSSIAYFTIRIVCPVLILFGIYLIMNGHISPGGGFQGGVVAASFFICRYMIYKINDLSIERVITLEKLVYVGIILLAASFIFLGAHSFLPIPKSVYLIMMNALIGAKVTCGFLIIFYRFIAIERR